MDSVTRSFDPGPHRPTPISFPNGSLKKHQPHPPVEEEHPQYRECLRNHAASLGGHAVDGCCEFMPSPSTDPAVPTSLTCDACGCHRNFHRRLPPDVPRIRRDETDGDDEEDSSDDDDDGEHRLPRRRRSSVSPPPYSSAPHMLLALSGGGAGTAGPGFTQAIAAPLAAASSGGFQAAAPIPRKRFRTRFTAEQKERMREMSERLGWRMPKKDDAVVQEFCRQIGVERGVFKVWMHNNKHTYLGSPSSRGRETNGGGGGGGGDGDGDGDGDGEGNGRVAGGDNRGDSNYVVNGSPSSSCLVC